MNREFQTVGPNAEKKIFCERFPDRRSEELKVERCQESAAFKMDEKGQKDKVAWCCDGH